MPAIPVTFFNTNPFSIEVNVNNGPVFNVPGVPAYSWTPQSPSSGGPSMGYKAGPNQFGTGTNNVKITFPGNIQPLAVTMTLPDSMQWNSLQVYIFFNHGAVNWAALNNGQFVIGGGT